MPVLAALATVPGREAALEQCLTSLRPQVDRLHVVCHDMETPPAVVTRLADEYLCEPDTRGSAAKLHWARQWTGLYLGCDDDWRYPGDYVATMLRWVRRWKGRALVVGHGRVLNPRAEGFLDAGLAVAPRANCTGQWLNYPGCCALAFDTRLGVPDRVPGKNLEEPYLAIWAQQHRVPVWLVPHIDSWLGYQLEGAGVPTIWSEEKRGRFQSRNAVIRPHSLAVGWQVHSLAPVS